MTITGTGYILIILGLYGFLLNREFLYVLTIFFIPFTATSVINWGTEDDSSGVQPYIFFGLLWAISYVIAGLNKKSSLKIPSTEARLVYLLALFALIALTSLIQPYFIDGREYGNLTGALGELRPIVFSSKNITQYLYLLLGIIIAILIYLHNRSLGNYIKTIKIYTYSICFVMIWGWFQFFCYLTNIEYPYMIFNNSSSKFAGGFKQFLDSEMSFKRISSVAVEPSVLAQSVVVIIPFIALSIIYKQKILGKRRDILLLCCLILLMLFSTSSSGILALLLLSFLISVSYFTSVSRERKIIFIFLWSIFVPMLLFGAYTLFQDIINKALFQKADSYSALERWASVGQAWNNYLYHPLLGVGWGSITSFDLFVKILSNTGLIGFISFVTLLLYLLSNQIKSKKNTSIKSQTFIIHQAAVISFYLLIFSTMINGFSYVFGYFWLIVGLMMVSRFKTINRANDSTFNIG